MLISTSFMSEDENRDSSKTKEAEMRHRRNHLHIRLFFEKHLPGDYRNFA